MTVFSRRFAIAAGLGLLASCGEPNKAEVDGVPDEPEPGSRPVEAGSVPSGAQSLRDLLVSVAGQTGAPGLAGAYVNRDGVVFEAAAGVRRVGSPEAVTVDDPWHIGSDTKAMTAALYARLVESGRAAWGATLPGLFPDLDTEMDAAWRETTIEQLLSHRSGLSDVGVTWLLARRADNRSLPEQRTDTVRDFLTKAPGAKPGQFQYSNANYILAGAAIERVTGGSWEDAIRTHVFNPLGITRAGFGAPLGDAPQGHRADMFSKLQPVGVGPGADNPPALGPAGTVHLPLADWAKFIRVFLDPAQAFLSADSLARLQAPPPAGDYALGWGVLSDPAAGRVLTHAGSNTMWYAQAVVAPEAGTAILVASNCAGEPGPNAVGAVSKAMRPLLAGAPG